MPKCTLEELTILQEISPNPAVTQKEPAATTGTSKEIIMRRTADLQDRGIQRRNGKRNGLWEILVEI